MKYFVNINSFDELKKAFREYTVKLHPDKGGDATEFAAMMAEYETMCKQFGQSKSEARKQAFNICRGLKVYYFGPGMTEYHYIITAVNADSVEFVRVFDEDFASVEDVEFISYTSVFNKEPKNYLRPLSKKFGIGFYFDDLDWHIYSESEIKDYESRAKNFEHWHAISEEQKARRAAEAKERREAAERLIINKWRKLLRAIPEGAKDTAKKAALKHNIKVIFNHYFPGVKVSVSDTSKCWCEKSVISWFDGPTVEEVENIKEFSYFVGYYYQSDPYSDYGDYKKVEAWEEWRNMFGEFSDNNISYERKLSPEALQAFRADIERIFPQFVGVGDNESAKFSDEGRDTDLEKLFNLLGFVYPEIDWKTATDEEKKAYFKVQDRRRHIHNCIGKGWQGEGVNVYFSTLLRYCSEYYKMSEKSEEPQPQPQTESTEGAQPQSVEGVEVVELDNGRIAVVGETYEHRETLKSFGGWWNRRAQRWEFRADKAQSVREWVESLNTSHTEPQSHTESANTTQTESNTTDTHTEPQSAKDEPQPEPEPTTEAKDEPQPEPEPEEPTEGAKGVTISEGLAGAFAKVAAIVAAVVMVATSSAAQPEPETETEKGAKIVFSSSDTPDLQEIHTEPQSTTETDTTANADRLDALNLARLKAQQLTEENEHTAALFAELEALEACGVDVADILRDLQALDDQHRKKGYLTTAEAQIRYYMRQYAQTRAKGALSDAEYNALFRAA